MRIQELLVCFIVAIFFLKKQDVKIIAKYLKKILEYKEQISQELVKILNLDVENKRPRYKKKRFSEFSRNIKHKTKNGHYEKRKRVRKFS